MARLARRLSPLLSVAILAAALWVLRRELRALTLAQLGASLAAIPLGMRVLAVALTAANYAVLTGYDQLAFVYVGRRFPRWQIAMASFVGYAFANNVGFAVLSGASARYRFYSRWGLTADEISRIVLFYSGTFWLGLLVLGGWALVVWPPPGLGAVVGRATAAAAGLLLLAAAAAYGVAALVRRRPIPVGRFRIPLPPPRLVGGQFVLSVADWILAVAVLWVLVPAPRPPFAALASAFIAAQLVGLASHLPGGLGVFETLMVLLLESVIPPASLVPALLAFRVVYYLLPLAIALVVLLIDEFSERRHQVLRWGNAFGSLARALAPQILAAFTFVGGAVLLFSGATPAVPGRLHALARFVPLPVIEVSHFVGSLIGLFLLLVSHGLARRIDAAWALAAAGLSLGILASLFKGGDYEEALLLAALLALLLPARAEFDRRATLFEASFSRAWFGGVVAVVIASVWLGEFAFRHVQYSGELWWRFAVDQDAPRFLRATVGVTVTLLVAGLRVLLRPARPIAPRPSDADLERAGAIIATQTSTQPYLVYLRDKSLLWSDDGRAFLLYGVQGRTLVALGDPVGAPESARGLVRAFLERADDVDGLPVFYQVRKEWLHLYADYGLTFVKLGEEARVPLAGFSLEGTARKHLRATMNRLEREGYEFRVVPPEEVPARLEALREVSDDWLQAKGTAEKGFSLGFFDAAYLARFPVATIERAGRVVAFANVWPGPGRVELSADLMRYRRDAPPGAMDGLIVHLMRWGRAQGYEWFNLGMAPLSGLEASAVAPLWVRLASYLYEHGERYYNFQGLRAYKAKFDPVWDPRYLAYPGGFALPRVLADVTALIAGGYRRLWRSNARPARRA
jgi:phosphatidylglycerol lysyltransferase